MSERMESVTCGKCGIEAIGRFDAAFLIKQGYRQVDGKWVCHICTGLFAANLTDEAREWLESKRPSLLDSFGKAPDSIQPPNGPMTLDDLAALPKYHENTCFDCGEPLTTQNYSGAEQIRGDGTLQGICQNCYRRDDILNEPPKGQP